jgi:hypothetical protein
VEACAICGREGLELTKHHLVPKSQVARISSRRKVSPSQLRNDIIWVCHGCHGQIHALFTEKELAGSLNRLEKLLSDESVAKFAAWAAKQPTGRKVRHRRSGARA